MEYNNRVICGIFHVRTIFYENLECVLGNLTSPLTRLKFLLVLSKVLFKNILISGRYTFYLKGNERQKKVSTFF